MADLQQKEGEVKRLSQMLDKDEAEKKTLMDKAIYWKNKVIREDVPVFEPGHETEELMDTQAKSGADAMVTGPPLLSPVIDDDTTDEKWYEEMKDFWDRSPANNSGVLCGSPSVDLKDR